MFGIKHTSDDAGLAGIGAIILFIAMVLVAAVAAGLYIDFSGSLQSQAQNTGEESKAQVSNQIVVVDVVGKVNSAGTNIIEVNSNVRKAAGAGDIDLKMATIRTVSETGAAVLEYNASCAVAGDSFGVSPYRDDDASLPVLNSQDDRANITLLFVAGAGGASDGLGAGEDFTMQITDSAGGSFTVQFTVPSSLDSKADETLLLR